MEKNRITPLVSIVIPMYNCQKYIERCINSLLQQTYDCIEVLVVDDGSTDKSADIVKEYSHKDSRVQYIYQKNEGPSVARNNAIKQSNGKYLLFVDADDYVSNDYVEKLVRAAEKNESELVITGYTMVYENRKKEVIVKPDRYEKGITEEWAYRISACCSRMYLRDFWTKNELQFYQEKDARAEDVPIVLYSNVMAKNIAIIKDAGYYYYQHAESAMNNKAKRIIFKFPYNAFEEMYKKVKIVQVENSMDFYYLGVLKCLAQFEFVIYRKADKDEKEKLKKYICQLIGTDLEQMISSWKKIRSQIELPLSHKCAIELFIFKYRRA